GASSSIGGTVRRLAVSLSALVALAVAVGACGSIAPYAAIVAGHRISERSVNDELNAIKNNKRYLDAIDPGGREVLGSGSGTFNSAFVARLLTRSIYYEAPRARRTGRSRREPAWCPNPTRSRSGEQDQRVGAMREHTK